jgi:DNA-binding PadR family transcriptional regulator
MSRDFRWSRGRRRVLLALLADADHMSGYPISCTAQARAASVYRVLDHLEDGRYVTAEWEVRDDDKPRRHFYRLTPKGHEYAMAVLELEPHADITEEI